MNYELLNDTSLWVAADTETAGLEAAYDASCKLHCLTVYINDRVRVLTTPDEIQEALDCYVLCFVNAKFDVAVLRTHGYHIEHYHDIAVANYQLMGARSATYNSLDGMANHYLGKSKLPKPDNWAVFDDKAKRYAIEDCSLTQELIEHVLLPLKDMPLAWEYYLNVDLDYIETLIEMYTRGVRVNAADLLPLVPVYEERIAEVVHEHTLLYGYKAGEIDRCNTKDWRIVGGMPMKTDVVNGKQVNRRARCTLQPLSLRGNDRQSVLTRFYPHLASVMPRTQRGDIKTDKVTLASISAMCPAADLWLEYEDRSKQLNTFLLPLIELANANSDGIVRAQLHNYNTRTGRLSCSKPNLQQVPAYGDKGAEVRKAFTAPPGYKVLVGDLDRIEVVVMAYYLKALFNHPVLAERLLQGDVHQLNADAWMCSRDAAKRGVFTVIYGGGPGKLAMVVKTSIEAARKIIGSITADFMLDAYRGWFVEQAIRNDGYVSNYFGGRLYIPELLSRDKQEVASGKRKAGNYPIQSTAGAVFKYMQNNATAKRREYGFVGDKAWQCLVCHDEVIYIVRDDVVDDFIREIEPCFNSTEIFDGVAVRLKFGIGDSWWSAKK